MKTNWIGLWKSKSRKDKAVYSSPALTQSQIKELPKKCRIVLMRNRYKNENGTSPEYVFSFMDAQDYEAITISQKEEDYMDKLNLLREGLEVIAEKCRCKYLDNDNDYFLYDTYEYCWQLLNSVSTDET